MYESMSTTELLKLYKELAIEKEGLETQKKELNSKA